MWTKIKVTQAHINAGAHMDSCGCPIARALLELVKSCSVLVDYVEIEGHTLMLPRAATHFAADFDCLTDVRPGEEGFETDDRAELKPIEFKLNIPRHLLKAAA